MAMRQTALRHARVTGLRRFLRCTYTTYVLAASLCLALSLAASQGQAQSAEGQARCLVLGPLVVSSYVAFLDSVAGRQGETVATRAGSAADLIGLYERVGCAMPPLTGALECLSAALIDRRTNQPISQIAQTCMREAGMPVR